MDHPVPFRILWTWDSWVCDPFDAGSYVSEFEKLLDFMAEWGYNGLIIWGFIDERHGGEAAAREVASYGSRHGIRVMPGIGAGGYLGYVISRGHEYNLCDFLAGRPDLGAMPRSNPDKVSDFNLCLYQQDSLDWLRRGAAWLAESFEIGGVNIETNEMGCIDICPHAAKATEAEPNRLKYAASFSDLARAVPAIGEEIKTRRPDAWITYATYEPPWWERQEDSWILDGMPADAIAQWNMELKLNTDVAPPVGQNVSLIHSGGWSYHLACFPPTWAFTQYRCFYPNLPEAMQFARNQREMGLDGFVLGNVGSPEMPDNELAYIAYLEFAREPEMTLDEFSARFIGRLYGERAEPLVKKLVLNQTGVHQAAAPVWRAWASLMLGESPKKLPVAAPETAAALSEQLSLAREAAGIASEGGRRRLGTIIEIIEEYRIVTEISARPELARLAGGWDGQERERFAEELSRLAGLAQEYGLPDRLYRYTALQER